jgi:hypothetical protein
MSSNKQKVVILSTSLLTDRVLLYSTFGKQLLAGATAEAWMSSFPEHQDVWEQKGFSVKDFPVIERVSFLNSLLKRANDGAWAKRLNATSILDMQALNTRLGPRKQDGLLARLAVASSIALGKLIALIGVQAQFEQWIWKHFQEGAANSPLVAKRLREAKPDLLLVTNPMWAMETAVAVEAKKMGIRVFSFIPSWDNITTKERFAFLSDAYAVWSDIRVKELHKYYPYSKNAPVYSVGAPQYDVFYMAQYAQDRNDFCVRNGLNPELPIVLYALGSPNFIKSEFPTALSVIGAMKAEGKLKNYQVLVRPHPNKQNNELVDELANFDANVNLQNVGQAGLPTEKRSQSEVQIRDWVSTVKHASVIINASSTILLDGAMFNVPFINVNYDNTESGFFDGLVKSLQHWEHLRTVVETNAGWYCNNDAEVLARVDEALANTDCKHKELKRLCKLIVDNQDGNSGTRLADAVLKTLNAAS